MKNKIQILSTISISSLLIAGGMLSSLLFSKPLKLTDLGIFVGLIIAAIGFITFGFMLYYENKQNGKKEKNVMP